MERMTPDYMVVGIGSKTESYKYKAEIISDETAFYTNEKKEISGICNQFLNGKTCLLYTSRTKTVILQESTPMHRTITPASLTVKQRTK